MAKGETKKTNKMLDQQRGQQTQTLQPFVNTQFQRGNEAYERTSQLYGDLHKGYSDMAGGNLLSGAGGPGGGGRGFTAPQYQTTDYGRTSELYDEASKTGLVDINALRKANPTFEKLMNNADLDPSAMARMRGSGVYDEFAKTGGYSPEDISRVRSKASSQTPAFFQGLQGEMNRARRIQGGSARMANVTALNLARQGSRATAEATLDAELGLRDRINEGRRFGAQGASGSELALQGMRTSTMLGAGQSLAGVERAGQEMTQQGRMFGTQGIRSVAEARSSEANRQAEANASAANASSSAADADWRFREGLRGEGLYGLSKLRGEELGAQELYAGTGLQGAGMLYGLGNEQLGMRYNAPGNNTSPFEKALDYGIGAAGALFDPYERVRRGATQGKRSS